MTDYSHDTIISLDVVVDHRLWQLFKPVQPTQERKQTGNHVQQIDRLGRTYRRNGCAVPEEELIVAKELAFPVSKGGITVILQQPARSHPYNRGINTVISTSPMLAALSEAFSTVSCGSLNLRDDVTVIDSLPFILPNDHTPPEFQRDWRDLSFGVVRGKEPDVVLCMSQDRDGMSEKAKIIQSIGVGGMFEESHVELYPGVWTDRVNAFHPSYAVNHNPHISCFRQLLLLEVAQACGVRRGDWDEKEWMRDLRQKCRAKAKELRGDNGRSLDRFRRSFAGALESIRSFLLGPALSIYTCNNGISLYNKLIESNLSETCNDASLCLYQMGLEQASVHPDDFPHEDKSAIEAALKDTLHFLSAVAETAKRGLPIFRNEHTGTRGVYTDGDMSRIVQRCNLRRWLGNDGLSRIFSSFLEELNSVITLLKESNRQIHYVTDVGEVSWVFLRLTKELEMLLEDLATEIRKREEINVLDDLEEGTESLHL